MALRAGAELEFGGGFLEEDDIAAAVVYAVENGARVVNMSFGDVVSTPLCTTRSLRDNNGVLSSRPRQWKNVAAALIPRGTTRLCRWVD